MVMAFQCSSWCWFAKLACRTGPVAPGQLVDWASLAWLAVRGGIGDLISCWSWTLGFGAANG